MNYELEAYLFQATRFRAFFKCFHDKVTTEIPFEFQNIWKDFLNVKNEKKGPLSYIRDKWLAHRSADDPRKDDDWEGMIEVLFYENTMLAYPEGKLAIKFEKVGILYFIHDEHKNLMNFFDWFLGELEK